MYGLDTMAWLGKRGAAAPGHHRFLSHSSARVDCLMTDWVPTITKAETATARSQSAAQHINHQQTSTCPTAPGNTLLCKLYFHFFKQELLIISVISLETVVLLGLVLH